MKSSAPVDVEKLYPGLCHRLEAIVARNVSSSPAVVEEACQVAWSRLHQNRAQVSESTVLAWLSTTASREALRMVRSRAAESSIDDPALAEVVELPARSPEPAALVELRERLAEVRELPVRQRRMVWLHAAGYEYEEIAQCTGDSRRTVERQLLRARRRLRALEAPPAA